MKLKEITSITAIHLTNYTITRLEHCGKIIWSALNSCFAGDYWMDKYTWKDNTRWKV